MAGTKDIKNFTKYSSLSDDDLLLGSKTALGGTDAAITVAAFRKQVAQDVAPTIKNGYWWVNGINTGVVGEVKNPEFRYTSWGLECKLKGQDDTAFQKLIPIADIKLDWDDLTPEQKKELKGQQGLSAYQVWLSVAGNADKTVDDYLVWLRKPATDAAARADEKIVQISEEASQVIIAANAATGEANTAAGAANEAATNLEELKTAVTNASYLAEEKAGEAGLQAAEAKLQAAEAKKQGEFAKVQGLNVPIHVPISEVDYEQLKEDGLIDDNVYYYIYEED